MAEVWKGVSLGMVTPVVSKGGQGVRDFALLPALTILFLRAIPSFHKAIK